MNYMITEFVKRQTADSRYGHFDGTWDELQRHIDRNDASILKYVDDRGVLHQSTPPNNFYSSVKPISGNLTATIEARREDEDEVIVVTCSKDKVPAKRVDLIFYPRSLLLEDGIVIEADWGLVSINCSPDRREVPMHPTTMARNQLRKSGGSPCNYTSEQWAEAVWFWSTHVQ
jgi:hypothetical protein